MVNYPSNKRYWVNWTIACGAGEFLGIAAAAGIWFLHAAVFGQPQAIAQKVNLIVSMIIAGAIEGTVTGALQWSVLKVRFSGMKAKDWLFFTALGAATAWILGMVPSTFFISDNAGASGGFEPSGWLFILMSALMGAVLGVLFGAFQRVELKKHVKSSGRWILANSAGWLLGMVVLFLGAGMPSAGAGLAALIFIGAISGLLAGLLVGAVTGLFLIRMEKIEAAT